jgi:hypothetical protein
MTTDIDPTVQDRPTRWVLASFAAAAGLVHLVMAPSHLGASAVEGGGFLAAAWVQLALAVALVARPTRWVLGAAVAVSLGLVAVWALSRTGGLPFGAHAHHPEVVSFVDGSCVAFELVLAALAALQLVRPGSLRFRGGAFAAVVPLTVFAVASAAIASPQARDHSVHAHGDHGADSPAAEGHGTGGEHAGHHRGEDPAGTETGDDAGAGDESGLAELIAGHDDPPPVELDAAAQTELATQLAVTAELVVEYPTLGEAEAKGANRTGPFLPGQGTHVMPPGFVLNTDGLMDPQDVRSPLLVFDGIDDDAPLAGFMYYVAGEEEPEGFVGDNDHWHFHTRVCMVERADGSIDTPFGAEDEDVTEEMCDAVGGDLLPTTGWMVHVWTVPGYTSDRGLFSAVNTAITCPDGSFRTIPWGEVGDRPSFCRNP